MVKVSPSLITPASLSALMPFRARSSGVAPSTAATAAAGASSVGAGVTGVGTTHWAATRPVAASELSFKKSRRVRYCFLVNLLRVSLFSVILTLLLLNYQRDNAQLAHTLS